MSDPLTYEGERGIQTGLAIFAVILIVVLGIVGATVFGVDFEGIQIQHDGQTPKGPGTITQSSIKSSTETVVPTPISTAKPTQITTEIQTQTPTLTPTKTLTATPTPTKTATATPGPTSDDRYDEFLSTVVGEAKVDAEIPVRLRGWTVTKGEVLIIVMNLTAESEDDVPRAREVNTLVTSGFAQAVYHHDSGNIEGKIPKQLRIAEVNNTNLPPKTLYVNTSLAREYYSSQITAVEFSEKYWETERNVTAGEEQYINTLDKHAGNVTLCNESASR